MKNSKLFALFFTILLLLSTAVCAAGENWLTGFTYRKSISITGQSGAGTNYPMHFTVFYGSGSDSGEAVYASSHCQTDFDDIRFTDDDGDTELDYWIETYFDSANASIWVEVADDLSSNQQIYIYYGNSTVSTTSSIVDTFIFGDDFDDNDITDWTTTGAVTVSGGELTFADVPVSAYATSSAFTSVSAFRLRWRFFCDNNDSFQFGGSANGVGSTSGNRHQAYGYSNYPNDLAYYNNGAGWYDFDTLYKNQYSTVTSYIEDSSADDADISINDGSLNDVDVQNTFSDIEYVYFASSYAGDATLKVDWVFVAKYIATEPAVSGYGSEETEGGDLPPNSYNVGDNGVAVVGSSVTVYSYWQDDLGLQTCYVEHNNTGTPQNYSISISGTAQWANETFTLNYTYGLIVQYRFFCSDNASQWNVTGYYNITLTPIYVDFYLNNSTMGAFLVDCVETANGTSKPYNYGASINLLGVPSSASYVWVSFNWTLSSSSVNDYDFTAYGSDTIWCYFAEAGEGEGETGFNWLPLAIIALVFALVALALKFSGVL